MDTSTVNADLEDLEAGFKKAFQKYCEVTGIFFVVDTPFTVEDMEKEISKLESNTTSNTKWKEKARLTLDILMRMGEFGAEAASAVWQPAAICFKVTQEVIECAQRYRENFTVKGVQAKLERIFSVLDDVELYVNALRKGAKMQNKHRKIILDRLAHFLAVCAIFTKVQKNSRKVVGVLKNIAKSIARDDDGIADELETIQHLKERERETLSIDTWSTNQLVFNYIKQQDREVMSNQKLQSVKDVLGLSDKSNDWESWERIHSSLKNSNSKKAHPWILDNETFKEWALVEKNPPKPVLLLEAPKGSGSTHLCCSAVEKLCSTQGKNLFPLPEKDAENINFQKYQSQIAYFYFEGRGKGDSSKGKVVRETPIRDALAALIWQLTTKDHELQTFLSRPHSRLCTTTELWDALIKDFPQGQTSKRKLVFFLILDEINLASAETDEDMGSILNRLIKGAEELQGKQYQVRILLTGRPETFKGLSGDAERAVQRFSVELQNRKDIEAFIRDGISKAKNSWDEEQKVLLDRIQKKLLEKPIGNFEDATLALEEIQRAKGDEELREILNRGPGNRSGLLSLHLEKLNERLQPDAIEELNDLLICLVLFEVWPNTDQLTKFLRLGKDTWPKKLSDRIRNDYYQLIGLDNKSTFTRTSRDTWEYFRRSWSQVNQGSKSAGDNIEQRQADQGSENAGDKIELIELEAIERLISSLCGAKVFDQFQFKDHFDRLRDQQKIPRPIIEVDFAKGHLKIISRLLKAVCAKGHGDFKCLHAYAGLHLPFHLGQIKPNEVEWKEQGLRDELHSHVRMFFTDENCVDRWFNPESRGGILAHWDEWYESLENAKHWFEDTKSTHKLPQSGKSSPGTESVNISTESIESRPTEAVGENVERGSGETLPNSPATSTDGNSPGDVKRSEWVQDSGSDPRGSLLLGWENILRVLIKILAKRWLRDFKWGASSAFNLFLAFAAKGLKASIMESSVDFNPYDEHSTKTIAEAERVASVLCGDPKNQGNQVQDVRAAETFLKNAHYQEAIDRCEKYDTNWRANWCVAQAYSNLNRPRKALKALERNSEELLSKKVRNESKAEWESMVKALCRLSKCSTKPENTTRLLRQLHESSAGDQSTNKIIFECVYDSEALMYFLSSAYNSPVNLFIQYAVDPKFHDNVCAALPNDLGGIIKIYLDAIAAPGSDIYTRAHLRFYYGKALFRNEKVQEAMIVWEDNVNKMDEKIKRDNASNDDLFEIRNRCAVNFVWGSISLIRKPDHSKLQVAEFTRKVEHLKSRCDFALKDSVHHLTLLLGRHYALDGQSYRTRRCIHDHVERAMELLVDDTHSNDWQGYWRLCQALIPVQDDDNVKAAWSLIEDEHRLSLMVCAGGCGCKGDEWAKEDVYVCRECEDVLLNEKCLNRLRQGELRVCGKDHDHIRLPRWDANASKARRKERKVKVGSEEMEIDEWLKRIKEDYGIQSESKPELTEQQNQRFRKAVESFQVRFRTLAKSRSSKTMSKSSESRKSDSKLA